MRVCVCVCVHSCMWASAYVLLKVFSCLLVTKLFCVAESNVCFSLHQNKRKMREIEVSYSLYSFSFSILWPATFVLVHCSQLISKGIEKIILILILFKLMTTNLWICTCNRGGGNIEYGIDIVYRGENCIGWHQCF